MPQERPGSVGYRANVLGKYVDYLETSYTGNLRGEKAAMSRITVKDLYDQRLWPQHNVDGAAGGTLIRRTSYKKDYPLCWSNDTLMVWMTFHTNRPNLCLRFDTRHLYESDLRTLQREARECASLFMEPGYEERVSRVELAVDFQKKGWRIPPEEDLIKGRFGLVPFPENAAKYNGFQVGRRWHLAVKIYDKSARIEHDDRQWLREVWRQGGRFDPTGSVIRVEFSFGRDKLRELDVGSATRASRGGIQAISDLEERMGDLVRLAVEGNGRTQRFAVLSPGSRKSRKDRRPLAAWWEVVMASFLEWPVSESVRVTGDRNQRSGRRPVVPLQSATHVAKFAALAEIDEPGMPITLNNFAPSFRKHIRKTLVVNNKDWRPLVDREKEKLSVT